jgi:AraC-like DNA-binding protein
MRLTNINSNESGNMQQRMKQAAVEQARVRIGGMISIPAVLKGLGSDPGPILAEAGVDGRLFDDPENQISYLSRGHLLDICVARTGCQHFGLLVGQRNGLEALGLVGLLVKYSTDVGTALRSLVRYRHLHVRGAVATLEVEDGWVTLGYATVLQDAEGNDQVGDAAVASIFNIMRSLCGPDWNPAEVRFSHRRPVDVGPYRRYFRAPLRFDSEQYAVVFAAEWLARRLGSDDPMLHRLLQQQIDTLESRHGDDFPGQVRSVLRTGLLTGHGSAGQVAALFSIHGRTLHRRLKVFGTNFHQLADECRFEIARQMLEDSTMNVSGIASALDYADVRAFSRAFRRWSGTTPVQWRLKHVRAT